MIPVLSVPILNRGDLLLDLVSSIDFPVQKLAIVQNGHSEDVVNAISKIREGINPHVKSVYVSVPFRNLGVSPSWNHIITSFPESEFTLICGNDIKFLPGNLEKIYKTFTSNPNSIIFVLGFACFGITPNVVKEVGLFDENIYPAYFEDNDYHRRIKLSTVQEVHMGIENIHPKGSQTIKSDSFYNRSNATSFSMNHRYYIEKWGSTTPNHQYDKMNKHPFKDPTRNLTDWKYDPERKKQLNNAWGNMERCANKTEFGT
jgi:GT2 family glycosyltransferase